MNIVDIEKREDGLYLTLDTGEVITASEAKRRRLVEARQQWIKAYTEGKIKRVGEE